MEDVMDRVIAELMTMDSLTDDDGGFQGIADIQNIYFGDPGIFVIREYPLIIVRPGVSTVAEETTGYTKRDLEIFIDAITDVGESSVNYGQVEAELSGQRVIIKLLTQVQRWFERNSIRNLGGAVDDVKVGDIDYDTEIYPDGNIYTKPATLTLTVRKRYPKRD